MWFSFDSPSRLAKYAIGYILTDPSPNNGPSLGCYEVPEEIVHQWNLTNLPVYWQHQKSLGSFDKCQVGTIEESWLDHTWPDSTFAVAVLISITNDLFLASPFRANFKWLSLSYKKEDKSQCTEVSFVRTGQRKNTLCVFVEKSEIERIRHRYFGYRSGNYKRVSESDAIDCKMATNTTMPSQPQQEKEAADVKIDSAQNECSSALFNEQTDALLKECDSLKRLSETLNPEDFILLIGLLEKRESQFQDLNQQVTGQFEVWGSQLSNLIEHLHSVLSGDNGDEVQKRIDDFKRLQTKFQDSSCDKSEYISASFDTLKGLTKNIGQNDTRAARDYIRKKIPSSACERLNKANSIEELMDLYADCKYGAGMKESKKTFQDYYQRIADRLETIRKAQPQLKESGSSMSTTKRTYKQGPGRESNLQADDQTHVNLAPEQIQQIVQEIKKVSKLSEAQDTLEARIQAAVENSLELFKTKARTNQPVNDDCVEASFRGVTSETPKNYWKDKKPLHF